MDFYPSKPDAQQLMFINDLECQNFWCDKFSWKTDKNGFQIIRQDKKEPHTSGASASGVNSGGNRGWGFHDSWRNSSIAKIRTSTHLSQSFSWWDWFKNWKFYCKKNSQKMKFHITIPSIATNYKGLFCLIVVQFTEIHKLTTTFKQRPPAYNSHLSVATILNC